MKLPRPARAALRIALAAPLVVAMAVVFGSAAEAAPAASTATAGPAAAATAAAAATDTAAVGTDSAYDCWNEPFYPWVDGNGDVATHVNFGCDEQMREIHLQVDINALDPRTGKIWGHIDNFTLPNTSSASVDSTFDPEGTACPDYTQFATAVTWDVTAYDGTTWTGYRQLDWVPLDPC